MGRFALIALFTFGLSLGIIGNRINNRITDGVKNGINFYDKTRAEDIASSAVEIYIKKMRDNIALRTLPAITSIMQGRASGTITVLSTHGSVDSLLMTTIGVFDTQSDTIWNILSNASQIPTVTGAISVTRNINHAYISNQGASSTLTGDNYDAVTGNVDLSSPSVDGISMANQSSVSYPSLNFSNVQVSGVKGGPTPPDTAALGSAQPDYNYLPGLLIPQATRVITSNISGSAVVWGTYASPEVTYLHGTLNVAAPVTGAGVLILDGKININQHLNWKGLILVVGNAVAANQNVSITNVDNSYGAIILTGPNVTFQQPGNGYFHYSADGLANALENVFTIPDKFYITSWRE